MQSCGLAVMQSCGRAVMRSCSPAVLQSCSPAVQQSCQSVAEILDRKVGTVLLNLPAQLTSPYAKMIHPQAGVSFLNARNGPKVMDTL